MKHIVKFYKYTFVPLILSIVLLNNTTVKAMGQTSFTITGDQSYSATINYQTPISTQPTSIEPITGSPTDDKVVFKYNLSVQPYIGIPYSYKTSSGYYGGYLNGYVNFTINMAPTYSAANTQYYRMEINPEFRHTEEIQSVILDVGRSGNNYIIRVGVTLSNYSILNSNTNRNIEIGNIPFSISMTGVNTSDAPTLDLTLGITNVSASLTGSPVADAGSSIAGQVYAAIENSISVSDIVNYLSLINDSNGDINVAVSHINESLIPSVISYLQDIRQNGQYTNVKLDTIITYLYAISSRFPNYSAQVLFYLEQLVNMNAEQSSIADEIQNEYESKAATGQSLAQGMEVVIPEVNQSNFDINAGIDTGTITTLSAFWSMFTHNSLISLMFTIAIAGIAAGFFLYGKKG